MGYGFVMTLTPQPLSKLGRAQSGRPTPQIEGSRYEKPIVSALQHRKSITLFYVYHDTEKLLRSKQVKSVDCNLVHLSIFKTYPHIFRIC